MLTTTQGRPARREAVELCALGFLTLFLELALIRYLGGFVWNLGYFPNLVVMAAFVGMGLGFLWSARIPDRFVPAVFAASPCLLFALVLFILVARPSLPGFGAWTAEVGGEAYFTATPDEALTSSVLPLALLFVGVVLVFATLSQRTARLFGVFRPLVSYTLDITGSVAGILVFLVMSWLHAPPLAWFLVVTALFLFLVARMAPGVRWSTVGALAVATLLTQVQEHTPPSGAPVTAHKVAWSPYQRIEYVEQKGWPPALYANGISHQTMQGEANIRGSFYEVPYRFRERNQRPRHRSALIIGAGSGTDVAVALREGVARIDAVDIDPAIVRFGRAHHPLRPYDDPRVTVTIDDGRAFMTRADRRYDLIIFALTDSVVKVSSLSQLRLENYLFTEESVRRAFSLLEPGGDLYLYNFYRYPWLVEKLRTMMLRATGLCPRVAFQRQDFLSLVVTQGSSSGAPIETCRQDLSTPVDDWPFLYLRERGIPSMYGYALVGLAAFIALLVLLLRVRARRAPAVSLAHGAAFFFMGVAFLLLETKSIIQFSLLFGTTWINASLVMIAVLASVLLANWAAAALRARWALPVTCVLLVATSLIPFFYPLGNLLSLESPAVRFVVASLLTFSPIFFANLVFSLSFRDQPEPATLFGWNLLGATLGGILEYASMALGYDALALVIAATYSLVLVFLLWAGRRPGGLAAPSSVAP